MGPSLGFSLKDRIPFVKPSPELLPTQFLAQPSTLRKGGCQCAASPGTASISGGRERGLPLSFTTHGITGSPRGLTPTRASVPEFFTTSLEESGSLPPPSKMLEPCKGTSLEMKCSTISDCVTRSPGTQPGSLFHALLPRRSWAPRPRPPPPSRGSRAPDNLRVPIFFSPESSRASERLFFCFFGCFLHCVTLWTNCCLCSSVEGGCVLQDQEAGHPAGYLQWLPGKGGGEACCPLAPFSLPLSSSPQSFLLQYPDPERGSLKCCFLYWTTVHLHDQGADRNVDSSPTFSLESAFHSGQKRLGQNKNSRD